jgi:hypothetical protein
MNILSIYKNTDVTNREMLEALKKLGYTEVEGDPRDYRMENKAADSYVVMPRRPLDENIIKAFTATFSNLLYMQGVIEDFDDLVKMVLKERTKKRREEKKQIAVGA